VVVAGAAPLHPPAVVTAVVPLRRRLVAVAAVTAVLPLWHLPAVGVAEELPHRRSPMGVAVATVAVTAAVAAVMAVAAVLPLWRLRTAVATVLPLMVAAEAAL
jgi:hypothetical protein